MNDEMINLHKFQFFTNCKSIMVDFQYQAEKKCVNYAVKHVGNGALMLSD